MGKITGVAKREFIGVSMVDASEPILVQPGEYLEVINENGGFTFRAEDGLYYGTQDLSVDDCLENIVREDIEVQGDSVVPVKTPIEFKAKTTKKITYDNNDELLLIF